MYAYYYMEYTTNPKLRKHLHFMNVILDRLSFVSHFFFSRDQLFWNKNGISLHQQGLPDGVITPENSLSEKPYYFIKG